MSHSDPSPSKPLAALPAAKPGPLQDLWAQVNLPLQVGLAAGLFAALLTIALPNQYKSETRILPGDGRSAGGGSAAAAAAAMGVNIPGQESPDAMLVDILASRSLRELLLQTRFTFTVRTWYLGSEQTRDQTLYEYLEKKNQDRALKYLKKIITVTRDPKTKLITITVETESPQLSQLVAQRMVRLLDGYVVNTTKTRGGVKAAFSEKRLNESRMEMAKAEDVFRAFLDGNRNYLTSPDPGVRLKGLRLDNELRLRIQLVSTLAIAREQALLEEKNDMPILNVLDVGNLPIDKSAPPRSLYAALGLVLGTALCWTYMNRARLASILASSDDVTGRATQERDGG